MGLQLADGFLIQSAACFMPKSNGYPEFFHIAVMQPHWQRVQQKQSIGFPGVSLRQSDAAVSHSLGMGINRRKICSTHTAHQLCPDFRINHPIQIEGVLRIIVEGAVSYTHLDVYKRQAG